MYNLNEFNDKTINSFHRLYIYCQNAQYKGWDNFDGLNSSLFKNSPFYHYKLFRLAWIQFFKRFPLNLRKYAFVPNGYNAKGLALFVSGLILQEKYDEAESLINILMKTTCPDYSDKCWGYNFDWQSKSFLTSTGTPNLVTTVFVTNALLDYCDKTNIEKYFEIAISVCNFFLNNLILFEDKKTLCFGYMPNTNIRVHNVNMLGAALFARVFKITGENIYYEKSKKAMTYAVNAINPDYSWYYGEKDIYQFIDNFHTGFNIIALNDWMEYTGEYQWKKELKNAYKYFLNTFWIENGCPKYYNNSLYPIDIHCSAQGIITFLKLSGFNGNSFSFAKRIAEWAIVNMQDDKGYFYYQKTKLYTNKIPYIRWSQAWMFYALSLLNNQTS